MEKITLKALRVNAGLTLEEASKKLDINKDTLSKYERGVTYLNQPMIDKILKLYNVSYDAIIFS